jgi:phage anti-repressor protein/septum formation inhibitor MinC
MEGIMNSTIINTNFKSKLIERLNTTFNDDEKQWYISNLYMYLTYDSTKEYPVNLDNVYRLIGFANKGNAKRTLENNFVKDDDYVIVKSKALLLRKEKQTEDEQKRGGHNQEQILLNVETFKTLCMLAKTDKGKSIRKYYIKLENIYNTLFNEERLEQQQLLEQKDSMLLEQKAQAQVDQDRLRESTILEQFPKNNQCVYYGVVEHTDTKGAPLIKFGISNDLSSRVDTHKKTYINFRLACAFKVSNHLEIENEIKQHPVLKKRRRNIILDGRNHTELLAYDNDNFSLDKINEMIKEIITQKEYNIENYNRLLKQNESLHQEIEQLRSKVEEQNQQVSNLEEQLHKYKPIVSDSEKCQQAKMGKICDKTFSNYMLYAFQYQPYRCIYGLARVKDLQNRVNLHKASYPDGQLVYQVKVQYAFSERLLAFVLKKRLTDLGDNTIEGSTDEIKCIMDISKNLEDIMLKYDIFEIKDNLMAFDQILSKNNNISTDAEIPSVQKAKRAVDQINKSTGKTIASYPSLEAAGRAIGVTGTAVGIAVRNKSLCKGYIFRYTGISHEDQYADQPVIKICCDTGEKTYFDNIAAAAKDCKVSTTGLRNRILTNVHRDGFHWIFNKGATHYVSN